MNHVILSPALGKANLPPLIRGEALPQDAEQVGTQNYGSAPLAIILGRAYDENDFKALREACSSIPPEKGSIWLKADMELEVSAPLGPKYGEELVRRIKAKLAELRKEGKDGKDGVYLY